MFISITKSIILYSPESPHYVQEYINYLVSLFTHAFSESTLTFNIILGNNAVTFPNNNKIFTLGINFEHTLVKPGGRDSGGSPIGNITIPGTNDLYLVRIENKSNLHADAIIDYSMPNIINILSLEQYKYLQNKLVYISPLLYQPSFSNNKEINILTTFINTNEPRRHKLLSDASTEGVHILNINNCFYTHDITSLYKKTKIILNIHQTDHHHTLEELRILPALLHGVLVIAEKSPLIEHVPYHEYIIWTDYDNIIPLAKKISDNYEEEYAKKFTCENLSKLMDIIETMKNNNIHALKTFVHNQFT